MLGTDEIAGAMVRINRRPVRHTEHIHLGLYHDTPTQEAIGRINRLKKVASWPETDE